MQSYEARTLSIKDRAFVMERDNSRCQYCGGDADAVDHIIPWSHSHSNAVFNLVAACTLCNSVASNRVFDTFLEKKNHILTRRLQMLSRRAIPIWFESEIKALSGRLRQKIEADCIVVSNQDEGDFIAKRLAEDGFLVTFGGGDELGPEQLMSRAREAARRKQYESPARMENDNRPRKQCVQCGKDFYKKTGMSWNTRKYCSGLCSGRASYQRRLERLGGSIQ